MPDISHPFDDILNLIESMPALDAQAAQSHDNRHQDLCFSEGLDIIACLSRHLSYCQGQHPPQLQKPEIAIFVGSHGAYPHLFDDKKDSYTSDILTGFQKGDTPLNQVCGQNNIALKVFEVGLLVPTEDISCESAMTEKEAAATMAYGMEALASGSDLLALTSIGAGADFSAMMVAVYLMGGNSDDWLDPEEAPNPQIHQKSVGIFNKVKAHHIGEYAPLEILRRLGGREMAAIMGAIIGARHQNIPILLDSLTAIVAALILQTIRKDSVDHCLLAHLSLNKAFHNVVNRLEMRSIIDLNLSTEGGIGAACAIGIIKNAVAIHNYTLHQEGGASITPPISQVI